MFMMYFFEISKDVLKRLDQYRYRSVWQGNNDKKKYRLAKWDISSCPKDKGGLGITYLWIKNKYLLSKCYSIMKEHGTPCIDKYLSS